MFKYSNVIKVVCLLIIHVFLRIVDSFCINESVILSSTFKCSDKSYQNSSHHVTHKAAHCTTVLSFH